MTPREYKFKKQYEGNTFTGAQFTITRDSNGVTIPIDLTNTVIVMNLREGKSQPIVKTLSINNGLTVANPIQGIVSIDPFLINIPPRRYIYDFTITFLDGTIRTYLIGEFEVMQNLA